MIARLLISGLCSLLFFLSATPQLLASTIRLPVPEREVLPNGLEIVWFVDQKLPLVDVALIVKSGSRHDPAGKSGTAELLAQTLDRGNSGQSALQIRRAAETLGATRSISAEESLLTIGFHGLAMDFPVLTELLGKIALAPDFPETEIKKQHAKIQEQWSHVGDYGDMLANLAHVRSVTAGTVFARGPFVSLDEFAKVGREDVLTFHKTHFTPKNSLLVLVGQIDKTKVKPKIEAVFGSWTGLQPTHTGVKFTDSNLKTPPGSILLINKPQLGQAQVRVGFKGPSIHSPDRHSLTVVNAMLGEYFNSRLNTLIRDQLGLTYAIGSGFSYNNELSVFSIASSTRNETVGQLIFKISDVLKSLKTAPVSDEELRTAKDYLIGSFPLTTATLNAVAARWISGYVQGLGDNYLNTFITQIEKVTKEEVQTSIDTHFDLKNLVITVVGNAQEIERSLKEQSPPLKIKKISPTSLLGNTGALKKSSKLNS